MRRVLSLLLKVAVSVGLLYLSLRRVNIETLGHQLSKLDWRWAILALLIACAQVPFSAWRWREVVIVCRSRLSLMMATRYTVIGQFFSQVLPSTVGGDAVRIWLLARGGAGWPTAIYSVLIDRVVGVTVLAVLVAACLPWTFDLVHDAAGRAALLLIGFGAIGATLVFLVLGAPQLKILDRWWPTRHLATASRLAWRLCTSPAAARVLLISFAIHFMTVALAWSAAIAVHAAITFNQTLYLFLPVILIATIPISIAGWGVRESAMVLAFSYAGLAEGDGLIVSILFGLTTLTVGVIGGIVWIASGYRWGSVKTIEADTLAHDTSA